MSSKNLAKKFEQAANNAAAPKRSAAADSWESGPALPPTKTATGDPSASGLKAKFEYLANPPPPKKEMGKVGWKGDNDQGRKKAHQAGFDPTKPPPARSITDLP
eukprot:TRINITY_DN2097_c1_g1_i1.p1 TRINITY_DN2097_c1_g1~~TRINITY_DN2097_c1_g1_i1.p1  ORF type:complete len:104 (-),score=33.64 TRINITY_DN2097_c1_g1_i1:71-382(-)